MKIITIIFDYRGCVKAHIMFLKFGEKNTPRPTTQKYFSFSYLLGLCFIHVPAQIYIDAVYLSLVPALLEISLWNLLYKKAIGTLCFMLYL